MKFLQSRNIPFFFVIIFGVILPYEPVEADPIMLFLIIPYLLIQSGLAAPVALALLAKLAVLFGLKMTALLPLLAASGIFTSADSSENALYTNLDDNLGRIKRSTDFIQGLVGEVGFNEEKLLNGIFMLDSKRCGERLMCELAASQTTEGINAEEASMIELFQISEGGEIEEEEASPNSIQNVYRGAISSGHRRRSCSQEYRSCPYSKARMMQIINTAIDVHTKQPTITHRRLMFNHLR